MSLSDNIIKAVKDNQGGSKESTIWVILQAISPFLAGINLPLSVILLVISVAFETILDKKSLDKRPMPDSWLKDVSKAKDVSPKGLAYISKKLNQKGFISASEALVFLDIEKEVDKKRDKRQAENQDFETGSGAYSILSRAQKECGWLIDASALSKRFERVSDFVGKNDISNRLSEKFKNIHQKNQKD